MTHLRRRHFLGGAVLLGAGATGLTSLAACGSDDNGGGGSDRNLRFAWWGNPDRDERTQRAVDLFTEATGRGVDTEPANWGDYWEALTTQVAAGSPPDLMQQDYQYLADYVGQGSLMALDDYVPDPLDLSDVPEDTVNSARIDGSLYAVSMGFNTFALVSNQRVLADAGEEQPDNTLTWSQYFDLAIRVGENTDDGVWGSQNAMGSKEAMECWLHQRGKALYTADGQLAYEPADLEEWFTYWAEMVAAGGCPDAETVAELLGGLEDSEVPTGRGAFNFHWSNIIPAVVSLTPDEVGISMYPQGDAPGSQPGQYYKASMYLAVPSGSSEPDAAVELMQALILDPDIARELGFERGVPASESVRGALLPDASPEEQVSLEYVESVEGSIREVPPPPPPAGPQVDEEFVFHSEEVGFGRMSIPDAVEAFFTAANNHLA